MKNIIILLITGLCSIGGLFSQSVVSTVVSNYQGTMYIYDENDDYDDYLDFGSQKINQEPQEVLDQLFRDDIMSSHAPLLCGVKIGFFINIFQKGQSPIKNINEKTKSVFFEDRFITQQPGSDCWVKKERILYILE